MQKYNKGQIKPVFAKPARVLIPFANKLFREVNTPHRERHTF